MPVFSYTGIRATTGEGVAGVIEADSQAKAVEALGAKELLPTSLKRADASPSGTAQSCLPAPRRYPRRQTLR